MDIRTLVLGPLQTNTYLLKQGHDVILIDPASKPEKLIGILEGDDLRAILLTHGHFDHIKAVDGLYEHFRCPVYLHPDDEKLARDKSSGSSFGLVSYLSCPTVPLKEGPMRIGPFEFETVFTPGHTKGSVVYVFDDVIFSGDTLFRGSVGRTDLEGGDASQLRASLRWFSSLDRDYRILPGHDGPSTLSEELIYNPYLN